MRDSRAQYGYESRAGLQTEGCKHPPKEVLGSRKSVRRNKLPLPVKFDALLQLFGELFMLICIPMSREID